MSCECHKKIVRQAEEQYGETSDWGFVFRSNKTLMDTVQCGALTFRYHPKNSDGTPSKRFRMGNFLFTFCPFCGKKILDQESKER